MKKRHILIIVPVALLILLLAYGISQYLTSTVPTGTDTIPTLEVYTPDSDTDGTSDTDSAALSDASTDTTLSPDTDTSDTPDATATTDVTEELPPEPKEITLLAIGDMLMHNGAIRSGEQEDGTRDYTFFFDSIQDYLDTTDIKVVNQETILGGNELGFSGYPYFNSPTELGDSIAKAGFNVVLHATNHAADQKLSGLLNCVDFWKTHPEILMVGITEEPPQTPGERIPLLTVKDTTFAILNYTYSPNLEVIPKDIQGHLNMLCNYDEKSGRLDFTTLHPQVLEDIALAKTMADVVIVFPHWGTENVMTPSTYQVKWAKQMTEAGADLIIGTHPHVIQPVEWIESDNGNRALCFYSLGNYVSVQKDPKNMLEAMAYVTFRESEDGSMEIVPEETGAVPLVCHYQDKTLRVQRVYLLKNYTKERAETHGIRNYSGKALYYEDLKKWAEDTLGDFLMSAPPTNQ